MGVAGGRQDNRLYLGLATTNYELRTKNYELFLFAIHLTLRYNSRRGPAILPVPRSMGILPMSLPARPKEEGKYDTKFSTF